MKDAWTLEQVERLRKLVAARWSAVEIAEVIGRSRKSVDGKCAKLGLRLGGTGLTADTWTDERTAKMREMYDEGASAATIARALGGITRNAVIGKLHRLGLFGPDSARRGKITSDLQNKINSGQITKRRGPKPRLAPVKEGVRIAGPVVLVEKPMPKLRLVETPGRFVCLADLGPGECHWPTDDPGPGNMDRTIFCGAACGEATYCRAHQAIAFTAPKTTGKELARALRRYA